MNHMVNPFEKRTFLINLLANSTFKKPAAGRIFKHFLEQPHLLGHVHFVSEAEYCPRGLVLSLHQTQGIPFQYFKKHVMTVDPDKAFHDIRMNAHDELYIQLNMGDSEQLTAYMRILEENPYYHAKLHDIYGHAADEVVQQSLWHVEQKRLKEAINQALDEQDDDAFYTLVKKLQTYQTNEF